MRKTVEVWTIVHFMRKRHRRQGRYPRWRPLGTLTEDHCFILSIITVLPGINRKYLREIYAGDCELSGRIPLNRKEFDRHVRDLLAEALIRRGKRSAGERPKYLYSGPLTPHAPLIASKRARA